MLIKLFIKRVKRERERDKDRDRDRETATEKEREQGFDTLLYVYLLFFV